MPLIVDPKKQRRFALEVVRTLRQAGYEAYWAGGCVRDELLGRTPKDYDVATNARPEEIRRLFAGRKVLEVGAAFGVMTIIGRRGEGQIEVATFRRDDTYSDGRHPDRVHFSTAEEDAKRRDFTINGLFYDPLEQRVIDFVGGTEDLRRGIIRAIGDPRERFAEDKLRMLRAVRFAATFGFAIDPATLQAIREMAPQISQVSAERIAAELERCLTDAHRRQAIELLVSSGLAEVILPELVAAAALCPEVWQENLQVLEKLVDPSLPLSWAVLFCGLILPEQADQIARRLRFSNQLREQIVWLMKSREWLGKGRQSRWSEVQPVVASAQACDLQAWAEALVQLGKLEPAELEWWRTKLALPAEVLNPPPLVTGSDLRELGVCPGPVYRRLLQEVRQRQLDGELTSREEALRWLRQSLAEPQCTNGNRNGRSATGGS